MKLKKLVKIVAFSLALVLFVQGAVGMGQAAAKEKKTKVSTTKKVSKKAKTSNEAYLDLSAKLFKESLDEKKNTLISPFSVYYAMAMTANGARGKTLKEFEKVFGMKLKALNAFSKNSAKTGKELQLANGIWFKDDEEVKTRESFLKKMKKLYASEVKEAPFTEATLKDINSWVEKKTKGMIPEILDEIKEDAIMYLVNALAFEAEWEEGYQEYDQIDDSFTDYKGEKKEVTMMRSRENIFVSDKEAKGFIKPYKDSDYAFLCLVPNEGVDVLSYAKSLSGKKIENLLKNQERKSVEAGLPKFKSGFDIELSNVFKKLGLKAAFSNKADFSKMVDAKVPVGIGRILHKTFIEVDGLGTKAGAATVVEMMKMTAVIEEKPETVIANRPFIYMIIDEKAGLPIFIGTELFVSEK